MRIGVAVSALVGLLVAGCGESLPVTAVPPEVATAAPTAESPADLEAADKGKAAESPSVTSSIPTLLPPASTISPPIPTPGPRVIFGEGETAGAVACRLFDVAFEAGNSGFYDDFSEYGELFEGVIEVVPDAELDIKVAASQLNVGVRRLNVDLVDEGLTGLFDACKRNGYTAE